MSQPFVKEHTLAQLEALLAQNAFVSINNGGVISQVSLTDFARLSRNPRLKAKGVTVAADSAQAQVKRLTANYAAGEVVPANWIRYRAVGQGTNPAGAAVRVHVGARLEALAAAFVAVPGATPYFEAAAAGIFMFQYESIWIPNATATTYAQYQSLTVNGGNAFVGVAAPVAIVGGPNRATAGFQVFGTFINGANGTTAITAGNFSMLETIETLPTLV